MLRQWGIVLIARLVKKSVKYHPIMWSDDLLPVLSSRAQKETWLSNKIQEGDTIYD